MALTIGSSGDLTRLRPPQLHPRSPGLRLRITIFAASKKASGFKTGKFDSKNRRSSGTVTKEDDDVDVKGKVQIGGDAINGGGGGGVVYDDGFVMPELPGLEKDFWEGPEWDGFGFVVQYLWAFGILFALVACGVAVGTYNEGATDFKQTPAYKESIQARDFLEEPEGATSDVFELNPTEEAPSLE